MDKEKEQILKPEPEIKKKSYKKYLCWIALIILFVVIKGGIWSEIRTNEDATKKQAGQLIRDALYNTDTSLPEHQKYVDIVQNILEPIKIEYGKMIEAISDVDLLDLYEPSSFRSVRRMNQIVADLNLIMESMIQYKNAIKGTRENIGDIVRESFEGVEAEEFISEFNKGYNEGLKRGEEYFSVAEKYVNNILSLYEFLIVNFNYYEIGEESGESVVYFYYDNDINRYNKYMDEIFDSSIEFLEAEKEYNKYAEDLLKNYGLTISDFEKYLEGTK